MSPLQSLFTKIVFHVCALALIAAFPLLISLSLVQAVQRHFFGKREASSISNEVAVITGGAHGVGRAIAEQLAQKGCRICIADVNLELGLQAAKEISEKYNVKAKAYTTDVSNYEQVKLLHSQINQDFGNATILVNNAGIMTFKNLSRPEPKEVQRMVDVNFTSHYYLNQVFLEDMKKQNRGYIVATCSLAGVFPLAFNSEYTGTKYGVRGHMRALRQELIALGYEDIVCTTVMPYFLSTNERTVDLLNKVEIHNAYPLISGEDVAKAAVNGMLQREAEICLPFITSIMYRVIDFLPSEFQTLLMSLSMKATGFGEKYKAQLKSSKTH